MKVNWDDDRDVAVETAHRPVGQRATVRPTRPDATAAKRLRRRHDAGIA